VQKGHHGAQAGASCSIAACCLGFALGQEIGQPFSFSSIHFCAKVPSLIFGEQLLHGFAGFVGDDTRSGV